MPACDVEPGSPSSGGSYGCADVCQALKAAGCGSVTDLSEPQCVTECEATDALVDALDVDDAHTLPCQDEWANYKKCMTGTATLGCNGYDVAKGACRVHFDHYTNYCNGLSLPEDACMDNEAWNAFCEAVPATPNGKVCRGESESGCVMGGLDTNADLYCCP